MRIYLGRARFVINASLERVNFHTAWVRLFNGDYIKRHKRRDFVDFDADKEKEHRIKPIPATERVSLWNRLVSFIKRAWATLIRKGNRGPQRRVR